MSILARILETAQMAPGQPVTVIKNGKAIRLQVVQHQGGQTKVVDPDHPERVFSVRSDELVTDEDLERRAQNPKSKAQAPRSSPNSSPNSSTDSSSGSSSSSPPASSRNALSPATV